jgi:uncharacterized protein YjbI with pentapeptide repeats
VCDEAQEEWRVFRQTRNTRLKRNARPRIRLTQKQVDELKQQRRKVSGGSQAFALLRDSDAGGLDLSGFAWTDEDFTKSDLRGANLSSCNFAGAKFESTELWNADLSDSDLTGATRLLPAQLAATDLKRAKLPDALTKFEALETSTKLADNASKVFLTMLATVAFTFLTLAITTDAQLITNNSNTKLPVIGADMPILGFFWAIPIILLALFIYFHIYLQRLWEALATLPAVFPNGQRLDERSHPWLLTDLARRHLPRLQTESLALSWLQSGVSMALGYWAVPFTLAAIWKRLLPLHDWWIIGFHLAMLAIGIGFGFCALANRRKTFKDEPAKLGPIRNFFHNLSAGHGIPAGTVAGLLGLWLSSLALTSYTRSGALEAKYNYKYRYDPASKTYWTMKLDGIRRREIGIQITFRHIVGSWSTLQADYQEISAKPPNWAGLHDAQEDAQFASMKGARISGVHWAGISARNSFFAKAQLNDVRWPLADLRGTDFRDATLTGTTGSYGNYATCIFADDPGPADDPGQSPMGKKDQNADKAQGNQGDLRKQFHSASFHGGDFSHSSFENSQLAYVTFDNGNFKKACFANANLRGVKCEHCDLSEAFFQNADLSRSIFLGTLLQGADLASANLSGITLWRADLREANLTSAILWGATLGAANLEKANLASAILSGADLGYANLENANLQEAYIENANLQGANLQGANLRSANLQGANLRSANLQNTDLRRANFQGADLEGANLEGVLVSDLNDLKGTEGIYKGKVIVEKKGG